MTVTATAISDMAPCPRVEIVVTGAPSTVRTYTCTRLVDGEAQTVRGAMALPIASQVVTDYEVPLEVQIAYRVDMYSASGALIRSETSAAVWADSVLTTAELAIAQDPLSPTTAMPLMLDASAVETLSYERDLALVEPSGPGQRLAIGSRLRGAKDIPFGCYTLESETQQFLDLMTPGVCVLLRTVPPVELPRLAYVATASLERRPIHRDRNGWTSWSMRLALVRAPAAAVAVPVRSWADWQVEREDLTWNDFTAMWSGITWVDFMRNPARRT